MIVTNLNKQDLRRLYGSTYYQRGRQYYDDNRVADFSWDEDDDTIFALVRGSGRKMYEVDVAFTLHNDVIHVASACSCPLGGDCKHVIAALLHYIDYVQNGHRGSKQRRQACLLAANGLRKTASAVHLLPSQLRTYGTAVHSGSNC